jgi:transcriptional regulator with XRE-family HTH domain
MLDYAIKGCRADQPAPYPTSWFVFRPLFGAATALAIYVLFRAGQLVVSSDAGPGSGDAGLNPFLIAFMAIIAGLMSWQALDFIQRRGETWLASQAREPMWASGLAHLLADRRRSVEALAAQVGRSPRQIERWLRFRDRVSPEMQERVLSALDAQPEQVFANARPSASMALPRRHCRNLKAALEAADRTVGGVAHRLGVEKSTVEAWSARTDAVDTAEQEGLADFLDRRLDELFEPMPAPASPAEAVAPPAVPRLAEAMRRKGVTAAEVAARLAAAGHAAAEAEIEAWCSGETPVPEELRPAIAAAIGVAVPEIAWA